MLETEIKKLTAAIEALTTVMSVASAEMSNDAKTIVEVSTEIAKESASQTIEKKTKSTAKDKKVKEKVEEKIEEVIEEKIEEVIEEPIIVTFRDLQMAAKTHTQADAGNKVIMRAVLVDNGYKKLADIPEDQISTMLDALNAAVSA